MTALLYISYSSGLSEADDLSIDKSVFENRLAVSIFVKEIRCNVTAKTKRLIIVICFTSAIWLSILESREAIGLNTTPTPWPSYPHDSKVQIAEKTPKKEELIVYKSPEEMFFLMYLSDPRLASNPQLLESVKRLRGGDWEDLGRAMFAALVLYLFSKGQAFVINNPNQEGVNRLDQYQPPSVQRHPPVYELLPELFPKGTCTADRPGGSRLMAEQSNRDELSNNVVRSQPQISEFVKNGEVNLEKCLDEVNRRASVIGRTDFECSLERFKALATENGELTIIGAREAITVLQGEMQGYYTDARRENYGLNVKGPDFLVKGLGDFQNVTHVEIKNPVGSAIKIANGQDPSISKQGKGIGQKIVFQQKLWSKPDLESIFPTVNLTASFPQAPNNMLGVVDNFDVPYSEKASMEKFVLQGSKNNTNILFIN